MTPDTAVTMQPCTCPCGCTQLSTLAMTASAVLARHARCADCQTPEHLAAHPSTTATPAASDPGVEDGGVTGRPITHVHTPDPAEQALAQEVLTENARAIWREQWARWQASLPEKFRTARTEHPQVLERLKRLRDGKRSVASLAVLGSVGAGKTYLAVSYANMAIREGLLRPAEVLFGSEAELLAGAVNSSFGEVEPALRRITDRRFKMLVIDDVGRGTWLREDMRSKVFSLVLDKYWSDNRVIVMTSNLSSEALAAYLGEGAIDRLRSMTGYGGVILDSEHKRRKVTQEILDTTREPSPEPTPPPGSATR